MARGHQFTRGRTAAPRRQTTWIGLVGVRSQLTSAGGTIFNSLNAAALALRPFTIIRTHILVGVKSDQVIASEVQIGAFAGAVVSDEAVAVGVSAVPTPISQPSSDLWFAYGNVMSEFVFLSSVGFDAGGGQFYAIDSKAMRRVEPGSDIVFVGEVDASAGSGLTMTTIGRMLVKLH